MSWTAATGSGINDRNTPRLNLAILTQMKWKKSLAVFQFLPFLYCCFLLKEKNMYVKHELCTWISLMKKLIKYMKMCFDNRLNIRVTFGGIAILIQLFQFTPHITKNRKKEASNKFSNLMKELSKNLIN